MTSSNHFDLIVSLIGLLANLLALEAVVTGKFSLAGYRRFLISLLLSDLCICTINILLFLLQTVSEYENLDGEAYKCLAEVGRSLEIISLTANLLNLCGMSVDHFIGIVYPLKYRYISHGIIAKAAVFIIWGLSLIIGFADYPLRILAFAARKPSPSDGNLADINSLNSNCSYEPWKANSSTITSTQNKQHGSNNSASEDAGGDDVIKLDLFDISELNYIFTSVLNSSFVDDPCLNMTKIAELQRHHSREVEEAYGSISWCAYFDGSYKVWLECIVMSLSLISLVFLGACYGRVFREAVGKADRSKQKLRKLVLTTILLLGTFILCWVPFVTYEVTMVLILRWSRSSMSSSSAEAFFIAHNVLHSLCIACSPLLVPIIYAARIRVVQRRFLQRYGCLVPSAWRRVLGETSMTEHRRSEQSQQDTAWLRKQRSNSIEELFLSQSNNEKIVGARLHSYGYCQQQLSNSRDEQRASVREILTCSRSLRTESLGDVFLMNKINNNKRGSKPRQMTYIDD